MVAVVSIVVNVILVVQGERTHFRGHKLNEDISHGRHTRNIKSH